MTVDILYPNADDSGWEAGTWDDCNNTIASPSGTPLETSIDNDVVVIDLTSTVIVDSDTVNSVTVKIRAKDTGPGGKNTIEFDVDVGGGGLGTALTPNLTGTYANYDLTNILWDVDHTAAQLNAMQLLVRANQTGMGETADWQIDELEVHVDYTASGISVAVGQASETDTANAITPFTPTFVDVGVASETDTANVITPSSPLAVAVGIASEVDTANIISPNQPISVGIATETDTANAITPEQNIFAVVGTAAETDSAGVVIPFSPLQVPIGVASEVDTANVILPDQPAAVGTATEVDTANPITPQQDIFVLVGTASETDSAGVVTPASFTIVNVGTASEVDTANAIQPILTLGIALEVDSANVIQPVLTLGIALETDTANPILPQIDLSVVVGQATEIDSANAITPQQDLIILIGVAVETDSALAITPISVVDLVGGKYNVQATFPTGQIDVVITLYDPLTGDTISLDDASCVEIGSTGMYIWGNNKLTVQPVGYQEYLYQITDGATTQDGVLILAQYELVQHYKGLIAYG